MKRLMGIFLMLILFSFTGCANISTTAKEEENKAVSPSEQTESSSQATSKDEIKEEKELPRNNKLVEKSNGFYGARFNMSLQTFVEHFNDHWPNNAPFSISVSDFRVLTSGFNEEHGTDVTITICDKLPANLSSVNETLSVRIDEASNKVCGADFMINESRRFSDGFEKRIVYMAMQLFQTVNPELSEDEASDLVRDVLKGAVFQDNVLYTMFSSDGLIHIKVMPMTQEAFDIAKSEGR